MRIVFLAVDDEFAGEMQRPLYEAHPDWIVGSVISSCMIYKRSKLGGMLFVLRKSGPVFLAEMIYIKILKLFFDKKTRFLPSQLARTHGVEQFISSNINDEQSVATLHSWNPDLIISTNFNHYIGKRVSESIARYGCWNLHKALLPKYRGMAPSFHALLNGEAKVGATLHIVTKGFDAGGILAQIDVAITKSDSVYSLNRKTSRRGGKLLASFLESFDPETVVATPQPEGYGKYYTYPTYAEVRAFRNRHLLFDGNCDDESDCDRG